MTIFIASDSSHHVSDTRHTRILNMFNIVVTLTILYIYIKLFPTEMTRLNQVVRLFHLTMEIMRVHINFCRTLKTLVQLLNLSVIWKLHEKSASLPPVSSLICGQRPDVSFGVAEL